MEFELTPLILDEIIFAMENQTSESLLDSMNGEIVASDFPESIAADEDSGRPERFIALPEWTSLDGFRLMEGFVSGLRNPVLRDRLSRALSSGRGVFRIFKNIVKESPEAEKLWFAYKDKQMKRAVYKWYNGLRDSWGLERIGEEPEETEELVESDFAFRPAFDSDRPAIAALERETFMESRSFLPLTLADALFENRLRPHLDDPVLVAETPAKDFAGFIGGETTIAPGGVKMLAIVAFAVKIEYRGLGIGEELLKRFLGQCATGEYAAITVEVPDTAKEFAPVLEREGFAPHAVFYVKKP